MSAEMSDFKRCMFPAKEVVLEDGMRGPCGVSMAMWSWKLGCVVHVGSAWPCGRGRLSAACDPPPPTHPRNGLLPPSPIRQTINYIGCYYTDVMLQTKAERKVRELGARVLSVCCHTARPPLPTSY